LVTEGIGTDSGKSKTPPKEAGTFHAGKVYSLLFFKTQLRWGKGMVKLDFHKLAAIVIKGKLKACRKYKPERKYQN